MTRGATLFSGGGGVEMLLKDHIDFVHAVEYEPQIAACYAANIGPHVQVADVRAVDYASWGALDYLHASPVCKNFSAAKANGVETDEDMQTAAAVVRCLEATQPRVFTLENVQQYEGSASYRAIVTWLNHNGYMWHAEVLNAANFGGLIPCPLHTVSSVESYSPRGTAPDIVASAAMMRPADQARILAYDAVAFLVRETRQAIVANAIWPVLENAGKSVRQIQDGAAGFALMSAAMCEFELTGSTAENIALLLKECLDDPSWRERWYTTSTEIQEITIHLILKCFQTTASIPHITTRYGERVNFCPLCRVSGVPQTRRRLILRAVRDALLPGLPPPVPWVGWYAAIEDLIPTLPESAFAPWQLARLPDELNESVAMRGENTAQEWGKGYRSASEPIETVIGSNSHRAFIVSNAATMDMRDSAEPMVTITATTHSKAAMPRAWLVSGGNSRQPITPGDAPSAKLGASPSTAGGHRALLVNGDNASRDLTTRSADEPCWTGQSSTAKAPARAWLSAGRVVKMTPRVLARFQSFPDWYALPDRAALACTIIGNAVPPLLMREIVRPLL